MFSSFRAALFYLPLLLCTACIVDLDDRCGKDQVVDDVGACSCKEGTKLADDKHGCVSAGPPLPAGLGGRLSPSAVGRYWIDRNVRGQPGAPRSQTSSLQVAKIVARFPGAIGYMRADQMPDWVKAVPISGTSHLSPEYPLYVEVP